MLSPLAIEIMSAILRGLLLWFGSRLVEHHILTVDQSDRMVEALLKHAVQSLPLVAVVGWSVWSKRQAWLKYLAARLTSVTASEEEVKAKAETKEVKDLAFKDPATITPPRVLDANDLAVMLPRPEPPMPPRVF
jgi:hypothetical protein